MPFACSASLALLSFLLLAAPSAEAVVPLADVRDEDAVTVAVGLSEALLGSARRGTALVRGVPLDGGPAAVRGTFVAPSGQLARLPLLGASAERSVALFTAVSKAFDPERVVGAQEFAAAPGATLAPLEPLRLVGETDARPLKIQVDADRTFSTAVSADFSGAAITIREPGGAPIPVAIPPGAELDAVFAGDLVAYAVSVAGQSDEVGPQRLVLARWSTGEVVRSVRVGRGIDSLALTAAGRVVIGEDRGGGISDVLPGRSGVRRLTGSAHDPVLAGETVIAVRDGRLEGDQRLVAITPQGRLRAFGVPTTELSVLRANATHVTWVANGCLLGARVSEPARVAIAPGRCPRAQLFFDDELAGRVDRLGRVGLRLRCVSAPPPGCRGTVRLLGDGGYSATARAPFRIPSGARRTVRVALAARARRTLLREGDGLFGIDGRTTDPAGRVTRLIDSVGLNRGRLRP